MKDQVQRLFVIWSDPRKDSRHVVGHLWREDRQFAFAYLQAAQLAQTTKSGFALLPEFREPRTGDAPYLSRYLFSTFAQRIPSQKRPDFGHLMKEWGVEHADDQLEVLARSGGLQLTDRIELAEFRPPHDEMLRPLVLRLAAEAYFREHRPIVTGDALQVRHVHGNPEDVHATGAFLDGAQVGWVPRQYSEMTHRLLARGVALTATSLRAVEFPGKGPRWFLRLARA